MAYVSAGLVPKCEQRSYVGRRRECALTPRAWPCSPCGCAQAILNLSHRWVESCLAASPPPWKRSGLIKLSPPMPEKFLCRTLQTMRWVPNSAWLGCHPFVDTALPFRGHFLHMWADLR